MDRGFRDIFVDALDTAATLAIRERFTEQISETSEGSAEFANPATVTQPVQRSELPSGQPLNTRGGFSVSPVVLVIGGVAVLTLGLVIGVYCVNLFFIKGIVMALPLVPIVLASGFAGVSGFFTGSLLSDKLSTAVIVTGAVIGLFLIFILAQRFKLGGSLRSLGVT